MKIVALLDVDAEKFYATSGGKYDFIDEFEGYLLRPDVEDSAVVVTKDKFTTFFGGKITFEKNAKRYYDGDVTLFRSEE